MSVSAVGVSLLAALAVTACSPAFDWRESRPADGLGALFPCNPETHVRQVLLAGVSQAMRLASCSAGGSTFAVSQVDAQEPARLTPLLQALRDALTGNVASAGLAGLAPSAPRVADANVAGATAHPLAQRLVLEGRRADGAAFQAQAQFFCKGLRVYQVTVIGTRLDPEAVDVFFSSLKLSP